MSLCGRCMDGEAGRRDYRKQDWCNPFHVIAPSWQKITLSLRLPAGFVEPGPNRQDKPRQHRAAVYLAVLLQRILNIALALYRRAPAAVRGPPPKPG
jgi:hypothetical protein